MKKTVLVLLAAVLLMSFVMAEKFIVVKMKEEQINYHWQSLNQVKALVSQSDLPHRQVVYIVTSIDSLQKDIQSSATIDSTAANPPLKLGKK